MKRNLAWFTPHRKTKESKQQKGGEHPPPRRPPPTSSARYTTTSDLTRAVDVRVHPKVETGSARKPMTVTPAAPTVASPVTES